MPLSASVTMAATVRLWMSEIVALNLSMADWGASKGECIACHARYKKKGSSAGRVSWCFSMTPAAASAKSPVEYLPCSFH